MLKPWQFDNEIYPSRGEMTEVPLQSDGTRCFGFVYKIQCDVTGEMYIGKKIFFTNRGYETRWRDYFGSSEYASLLIKKHGRENFTRTVLSLAANKTHLSYLETKALFANSVLENPKYVNKNIEGKWFKGKIS